MGRSEMERKLRQYAAACNRIQPEEKESRIRELLLSELSRTESIPCTRGSLWSYVWEQTGYMGRYCLLWQILWIALFYYMIRYGIHEIVGTGKGNEILAVISLWPPILVLLTVEEVTKVYQRSMLEIEYATRYTLRSAVMIRMAVLCVIHSLIVGGCIICLHSTLESGIGRLLIYGFTPMIIVSGFMLKLMQYCQGEQLRSMTAALCVLTSILVFVGRSRYFDWYQPVYFRVWCIACAAGTVFGIRQLISLNDRLVSYERIVQ